MRRLRVAVDTGGTFTDFVVLDEQTRQVSIAKIPSSPDDPSIAVMEGIGRFLDADPERTITYFCHGTTVGTNALLEEKGARTGLLVMSGFRGIYEIMEQARPHGPALFDLEYDKPALLAPESRTGEVIARLDHLGNELIALDENALRETLDHLRRESIESLAICLLYAYLDPEHEHRVRDIVAELLPGCFVSLSSDVLPQIREYPRLSTTVINAYLQPIVQRYLSNLSRSLRERDVTTVQTYVMQSNGGTATFAKASEKAAATLLSGPAGGATAGARFERSVRTRQGHHVRHGDLSKKIAVDVKGEFLELRTTINTMVDQLRSFASEVTRVAREVGTEGKLGGQARVEGVSGTWKDLTDSVNSMASNLTAQVRNIADVTTAVARGRSVAQDHGGRQRRDSRAEEHREHDGGSALIVCGGSDARGARGGYRRQARRSGRR